MSSQTRGVLITGASRGIGRANDLVLKDIELFGHSVESPGGAANPVVARPTAEANGLPKLTSLIGGCSRAYHTCWIDQHAKKGVSREFTRTAVLPPGA